MLQSIRDKTSGWIAYLIIGLISIPFALWGINSYLGGGEEQPVALVDGDKITPRQLDYAFARYRERLTSIFGGNLPAMFNDEAALKEQALTQIIEETVLQKYIRDEGYRVGDNQLFENIQAMQVFHKDGRFSKEQYQNQIASQGYSAAAFEQELRRSQELEQLNLALVSSAFTLPIEVDQFNRLKNQERKLRTLTIENNIDAIEISDQDVTDYYKTQAASFMQPAMVKLDYIELSLDQLKQKIEVSDDKIAERYAQMRDQLTQPEVRSASHILLTVAEGVDEDQVKSKITEIKSRINQGEDFSSLAREFSQDPGSAEDGGNLGDIERGFMVKPFETALFNLSVDQVSEPVKTQFGWHLIKLHNVSGGETKSLEQARYEIEQELKTDLAESQIYDMTESLASIGYEQSSSLLPAAQQLELKVQTTDWFTRSGGEGIAEQEKIRQAAFSDQVLKQQLNSETIELSDHRVVLVHLNKHKPAEQKSLDSVRDAIISTLKKKKGREQAEQQGKKILANLTSGSATLDSSSESLSIPLVDIGFVKRSSVSVDKGLLNAAFRMTKPVSDKLVFDGLSSNNGDYTIIELSQTRVDAADTTGDDTAKALAGKISNYEYLAYIKTLAQQADIQRFAVKDLPQ
ncbi:MAG: SurA N-terminal domain-containing protein [Gammaproteobacteria bacterium]|nr:SurA N-terminal domain-containing protein [Gammaproteobacteria bacterium]MBL6998253.1 SurA N-terminal domain-containing protein [Gammaproteobacteria bacterium]